MTARLEFGTDGIRGRAGTFPIDGATAWVIGRVVGRDGRVLLAADPRLSSPWLVAAVAAGVRAAGGEAESVGVLPTPALSALLAAGWGARGVMVTASHNPAADNGLKVLSADGHKLGDDAQAALQAALNIELARGRAPAELPATERAPRAAEARAAYLAALAARLPQGPWLAGQRIALDAGFGAGGPTAAALLASFGAEVAPMGCEPDGARINHGCGALHPEALAARVREVGAVAGIALDGDADRCILVTGGGRVLDGDALLFLLAAPPAAVGTIMSGAGLEEGLKARGIELIRTPVGDRFVDAAVHARGLAAGAESSGHVCIAGGLPTADGTLTGLTVLAGGLDLDARLAGYTPWPRAQLEVPAGRRLPVDSPALAAASDAALAALG
ncbi:MAG: phosphoglucosamine mutase, partial [Pseudomonadota bacterium]